MWGRFFSLLFLPAPPSSQTLVKGQWNVIELVIRPVVYVLVVFSIGGDRLVLASFLSLLTILAGGVTTLLGLVQN